MKEARDILQARGIAATPNRLLVVDALLNAGRPLALADLEEVLPSMERSGIFRALSLLADSHVAHAINDGSRSVKYELCPSNDGNHSTADLHVHFHCRVCGRTFCLDAPVPPVALPEGYEAEDANYVVEGLCPACSR